MAARSDPSNRYIRYNANGELLDEASKTLFETMDRGFGPHANQAVPIGNVNMRSWKPPFTKIPKYDTKREAVQILVDKVIIEKDMPYYLAYVMGTSFVKYYHFRFDVFPEEYTESEEDTEYLDGHPWSKKIYDYIPNYGTMCLERSVAVHDRTEAWYKILCSCFTTKAKRKVQEDRMICLPSLELHKNEGTPDVGLFGVFDGHGGVGVSMFAAAHFPYEMVNALDKHLENTGEALKEALEVVNHRSIRRCKKENWFNTGSTVVVAAVDNHNIHIRWLGDSPAYMLYQGRLEKLTRAHTPKDPDEKARIEAAGGRVSHVEGELRVNGILSVSRALGDLSYGELISKESEALVIERKQEQYLLMMLSDGISEIFNQTQLYEMIKERVLESDSDEYGDIACAIVRKAKEEGATDNCTCVIVFLREPKDVWAMIAGSQGSTSGTLSSEPSQDNSSSQENSCADD